MAAARNKPKWREAANRIRLKRKGGRLGTGPCGGDAATKPNTQEGTPPTWRWEKENPDNFTVINEGDVTGHILLTTSASEKLRAD